MKNMNKRYPAKCCVCGNKFYATKSLAQEWGKLDGGHGTCPTCKTFLHLTFVPEQELMRTEKFEDYSERVKQSDTSRDR